MKIKYISDNDLNALKLNVKSVYETVFQNDQSLDSFFNRTGVIQSNPMEYKDIVLDMSQPQKQSALTDFENIKRVYGTLNFLSDSVASQERFWVGMIFSPEFIDYMKYRWPVKDSKDITNRYLYGYSIQRSLFRNGLSRLWWIGRVTYDPESNDPYVLTRFVANRQDTIEVFCGRNVFNSFDVLRPVLKALRQCESEGLDIGRNVLRDIGKYVNMLGGAYVVDALPENIIYNKVINKVQRLNEV